MLKRVLLISISIFLFYTGISNASGIEVEDQYDFQLAVDYAVNNNIDTLYLVSSGGVYTTTDTNFFFINSPLAIVAKSGLAEKPVITHSDANEAVLEIFRINADFILEGVILDGNHEQTHGLKYAIRAGEWEGVFPNATGYDIRVKNVDFRNFYQDKDPDMAGHAIYFLKGVDAGVVYVEGCTFENFGDEAIRMSETEKYPIDRCVDSLIVRNSSFTNVDCECIRFYADTDTATVDAGVIIENITVNRSATRMMYIKNNKNTQVRNVLVTNSRLPAADRAERADYVMQIQNEGSYITNVDTINMVWGLNASDTRIAAVKGGDVNDLTIFGFDPDYEDEANFDLRLKATSHAYYSGTNNTHLGNLNNAVNTPTVSPLNVEIVGKGSVTFSPERVGLTFTTGTAVTITAVPDSGYSFVSWTGDVTGTNATAQLTVDGIKNVVATFDVGTGVNDNGITVSDYSISQNYPNPFNPSTLIKFSLRDAGFTTLKVYDLLGKEAAVLVNNQLSAGSHSVIFDGSKLSSGIYFYQIQSGDFVATKKMMLIK